MTASFSYETLSLADIALVDVQCDYLKEPMGNVCQISADIKALEDSIQVPAKK